MLDIKINTFTNQVIEQNLRYFRIFIVVPGLPPVVYATAVFNATDDHNFFTTRTSVYKKATELSRKQPR